MAGLARWRLVGATAGWSQHLARPGHPGSGDGPQRDSKYFSPAFRTGTSRPWISLLLPLWDRLPAGVPAIVVVRSPAGRGGILRLRSGINPTRALSLWAEYYRADLIDYSEAETIVDDY